MTTRPVPLPPGCVTLQNYRFLTLLIPKVFDKFSLKIDLRKHKGWLTTLNDIHAKRYNYFFNHYIPEFDSQTTECNGGWDELWGLARELDKTEKNSPTMQKIGLFFCADKGAHWGGNKYARENSREFAGSFMNNHLH